MAAKKPKPTRQAIRPGETLLLSDFRDRAGLGRGAWTTVRDRCEQLGIHVVSYSGNQAYVHTDGWLQYLNVAGAQKHQSTQKRLQSARPAVQLETGAAQ